MLKKIELTAEQLEDVALTVKKHLEYAEYPVAVWERDITGTREILGNSSTGHLTAEQAADQMQNKISLYLSE